MDTLRHTRTLLVLLGLLQCRLASGQDDIGCYVPGECLNSLVVDSAPTDTAGECAEFCEVVEAEYFTHSIEDDGQGTCTLFANCADFSDDAGCSDCISGTVQCPNEVCFQQGYRCQGLTLDIVADVESSESCINLCKVADGCEWVTYELGEQICTLYDSCREYTDCADCVVSGVDCKREGAGEPSDETAFIFVADYYEAEVVKLSPEAYGTDGSTCYDPYVPPFPQRLGDGPVGITDAEGRPMICGGNQHNGIPDAHDYACYAYSAESDGWVRGPNTLFYRYYSGVARLADGRWWIAGGGLNDVDHNSSEFYDNELGDFVLGPSLPEPMFDSVCAVPLDDGLRVFLFHDDVAYIFDPAAEEDSFEALPPPPDARRYQACGTARSNLGGTDVFLVGSDDESEARVVLVFNVDSREWRTGPDTPRLIGNAYAVEFGDSFVVVGGYSFSAPFGPTRTIFEYDWANEAFVVRDEFLLEERQDITVVAVQQGAVNCDDP